MRPPKLYYQWNDDQGEVRIAYQREGKWVTGWGSKVLYDDLQYSTKHGYTDMPKALVEYFDEIWEEEYGA